MPRVWIPPKKVNRRIYKVSEITFCRHDHEFIILLYHFVKKEMTGYIYFGLPDLVYFVLSLLSAISDLNMYRQREESMCVCVCVCVFVCVCVCMCVFVCLCVCLFCINFGSVLTPNDKNKKRNDQKTKKGGKEKIKQYSHKIEG